MANKPESIKFLLQETPLGLPGAEGFEAVDEKDATAFFYACWNGRSACARCVSCCPVACIS